MTAELTLFGRIFHSFGPFTANEALEVDGFPLANEFSGEPFASSRRSTGELRRTLPNSGERLAYSGELSPEFGGLSVLANRWRIPAEFARVHPSSHEFAANDSLPGILPTRLSRPRLGWPFIHWPHSQPCDVECPCNIYHIPFVKI